jgi:hypothetical protein
MDIELPFDFKEFLKLLNENGVRYLLIGGYSETSAALSFVLRTTYPAKNGQTRILPRPR